MPTTITALPTPPNRGMAADVFSSTADTFLAALPAFGTQANGLSSDCNGYSTAAATSAANAATSATNAATSATNAAVTLTSVQSTAGVAGWVSGNTYAYPACAVSPINFQTYRKKTSSSVTTIDPSADATNWSLLLINPTWVIINANYTANANDNLLIDTSSIAISVTLPTTNLVQYSTRIRFKDLSGTFGTNNLTILVGSSMIEGVSENMIIANRGMVFDLLYVGGTRRWVII